MMAAIDPANAVFFDLSPRTKLRITGNDRLRYLNGQLTNNVSKATASSAIAACLLNAKGKMQGYVFISAVGESSLIDAEREMGGTLQSRLERYVIADDVQIEDISPKFSIFHAIGSPLPKLPGDCRIVSATRFRQAGHDIWVENTARDAVFEKLAGVFSFRDDPSAEVFRIELGIPQWGRELTEEIIPLEANLEEACIDYEKGCYIGQEVISRMRMSGQRNKKLCGLISVHGLPLEAGMKLFPIGEEKKEVGWITSATHSKKLGKEIGLGFMKRPFYHATFRLDAVNPENPFGSAAVRVEIADLPFTPRSNGID
jgi:folate-binding protein YgfZ